DLTYACTVGLVGKASQPKHYDRLIDYALKLEREYTVFMVKLLYQKDKDKTTKAGNWRTAAQKLYEDGIIS
ncbi:MAG: hypothetical protein ACXQT3_06265, partial [Methermicoccaceae archaeon]